MTLETNAVRQHVLSCRGLSFTAHEAGSGPLVLCLHGFPDSPATFRHLLPALAAAGYRAVAVTMRGYEPGSQPADNDYGALALAEDVVAWIEALGERTAHLVGHDWGASIAFAAAALSPERVQSLTVLSVPHPGLFAAVGLRDSRQMRRSWYMFFFQFRGLADWIVARNRFAFLKWLIRRWSPGWTPDRRDIDALEACFSAPGVLKSALQYYRTAFNTKAPRQAEGAALFGKPVTVPTLGLCGEDDGCIGADIFVRCMDPAMFTKGVETRRIAGAGHFLQLERPDEVNRAILSFIDSTGR